MSNERVEMKIFCVIGENFIKFCSDSKFVLEFTYVVARLEFKVHSIAGVTEHIK